METAQLAKLLTAVQEGRLSVAEAVAQWPDQAGGAPDFVVLDHGRAARTGMPEVVFCQGKTPEQVVTIVGRLLSNEGRALATRASVETGEAVMAAYPQARWHQAARVIALGEAAAPPCAADAPFVAVVTAGTSDIPVAEEAALTLEFLGHCVQRVYDVGVAGIHRLMNRLDVNSTLSSGILSGKSMCPEVPGRRNERHCSRLILTFPSGSMRAVNSVSTACW